MIYCVVPAELEDELYAKLVDYYAENDRVTVVVDRRSGRDRRSGKPAGEYADRREPGDRRRRGAGGFVSTRVLEP